RDAQTCAGELFIHELDLAARRSSSSRQNGNPLAGRGESVHAFPAHRHQAIGKHVRTGCVAAEQLTALQLLDREWNSCRMVRQSTPGVDHFADPRNSVPFAGLANSSGGFSPTFPVQSRTENYGVTG